MTYLFTTKLTHFFTQKTIKNDRVIEVILEFLFFQHYSYQKKEGSVNDTLIYELNG